jgi:hypothetical protein
MMAVSNQSSKQLAWVASNAITSDWGRPTKANILDDRKKTTAVLGKSPCTVEHIRRLSLNSSKTYTGARRDDTRKFIRVARYGIQRAMFHGMKNRSSAVCCSCSVDCCKAV